MQICKLKIAFFFEVKVNCCNKVYVANLIFHICVYFVLRTSIDLMKENRFKMAKKSKAEDTKQKQLRTGTKPMT